MPLTAKGSEILANMRKEYGEKKGESVFYASRNAGKISGVDRSDEWSDEARKKAAEARRGSGFSSTKDLRHWESRSPTFAREMAEKRSTAQKERSEMGPRPNRNDGMDRADKFKAIADAVVNLAESGRRLEERMDSFKEVEEHAKKEGARDPAAVAAAVGFKKYGKEGMEKKAQAGRKDASLEYHQLERDFAKRTAQKALEAGDHGMAKKWIDYGTEHGKQAEAKEPKMEGPPEADKKK